eukprot:TRINITY_DN106937_c0_g1_i1.p1 TRINITY_DN106937_c0_g1~~TRINITY_DN106937_c0_g1_i1.p1  ORF type:complete len:488 (-),score=86.01 TRINITY_DN106937_c0_g1_i1:64-1527(-)
MAMENRGPPQLQREVSRPLAGSNGQAAAPIAATAATTNPELLRWSLPVLAVLTGLLAQNVGLYLGTRHYVRWMDELHRPSVGGLVGIGLGGVESPLAGSPKPSWLRVFAELLEMVTDILPVIWCGLVVRTYNLRLWSQTLFATALLMTLKGFLAWVTVLPDEQGWEACQIRLGSDGLKYYRREAWPGSFGTLLGDLLLLEVRSVWTGALERRRYCADAMFCSSSCLTVVFSTSIGEAAFSLLQPPLVQAVRWQAAARGAVRCCLAVLVVGNLVIPVAEGYHRGEDVLVAIVLALLVYSNPAVAMAAHCWRGGMAGDDGEGPASVTGAALGVHSPSSPVTPGSSASAALLSCSSRHLGSDDGDSEADLQELGKVLLTPSWCAIQSFAHLRAEPPLPSQKAPPSPQLLELQLTELRRCQDQFIRKLQKKEDLLKKECADELLGAQRSVAVAERRIQEALADQNRLLALRAKQAEAELASLSSAEPPGER